MKKNKHLSLEEGCSDYFKELCLALSNPPYVCNGCEKSGNLPMLFLNGQDLPCWAYLSGFSFFPGGMSRLMMNHINSYSRASLGNHSPYEVFCMFYGQEILEILDAHFIYPKHVALHPELLKHK